MRRRVKAWSSPDSVYTLLSRFGRDLLVVSAVEPHFWRRGACPKRASATSSVFRLAVRLRRTLAAHAPGQRVRAIGRCSVDETAQPAPADALGEVADVVEEGTAD